MNEPSEVVSSANVSPQEAQILNLASKGATDREIAIELGLKVGTVRTYWNRLRLKLNSNRRVDLIGGWVEGRLHTVEGYQGKNIGA